MAGIGFELRKILTRDTYLSVVQAYAYAGVISSGPWILSIIGILIVGVLSLTVVVPDTLIMQFQLSATYLIAGSLIATGFIQPAFTRYIADRLYEKQDQVVLGNFHGALCLVTILCGVLGSVLAWWIFPQQTRLYRLLMIGSFVTLGNIWIATIFLSGLKAYREILGLYALGYSVTIAASLGLRVLGMEGLLLGFFLGQAILLLGMVFVIFRHHASAQLISWDFLDAGRTYFRLVLLGVVYNLAIWIDKFLFWFFPETSQAVIGPIRYSPFYDLPIFLAYLSILPAMASFLVRMETDFVEQHGELYSAIRDGAPLSVIRQSKRGLIRLVRYGLLEILKVQSVVCLLIWAFGPALLRWLGIASVYEGLLYVFVVAAGLQVMFLGILNVFFYLDKRTAALALSVIFLVSNAGLTLWSLVLGPRFYGYGFAGALLVTVVVGLVMINHKLRTLEYETFMLQ